VTAEGGSPTGGPEPRGGPAPLAEALRPQAATPGRRRLRFRAVLAGAALLLAGDLARAPQNQVSARLLLGGIDGYQAHLSRRLGDAGVSCRFQPTCSHFAEGAIRTDGALIGGARAVGRIFRCGPWTPAGTVDPP
jgi:putative membrane protein insertion efficiency factor